jgi:membrane glycosyltransferase
MGFLTLIAGLSIAPSLVAWMSPTILGLILAIFLSWSTGLLAVGLVFRRLGLLLTPEEQTKPPVVARANDLAQDLARIEAGGAAGLSAIHSDSAFRAFHLACLPKTPKRRHGDISPEWALADAKLAEAETMKEALTWLHPKERMAILLDHKLIARIEALPDGSTSAETMSSPR